MSRFTVDHVQCDLCLLSVRRNDRTGDWQTVGDKDICPQCAMTILRAAQLAIAGPLIERLIAIYGGTEAVTAP
jgi:hypothetical protein